MTYTFSLLLLTSFPHHLSFQVRFYSLIWNHEFLKWGGLTFELTISPVAANAPLMSALQLGMLRTSVTCPWQTEHIPNPAGWMSCWADHRPSVVQTPWPQPGNCIFKGKEQDWGVFQIYDNCREPQKWSKLVGGNGKHNYARGPKQKESDL